MLTKALFEDLDRFTEQQLTEAKTYGYGYRDYDDGDPSADYSGVHRDYSNQGDVSNFTTDGYEQDYTLPEDEQVQILQRQKDTLGKILKKELSVEKANKSELQAAIDNGASKDQVRDFKLYIKNIDKRIAEIESDLRKMYSDVEGGYQEESLEETWFDDVDVTTNPYRSTGVHRDSSGVRTRFDGEKEIGNTYSVSPEERDRLYQRNLELWKAQGRDPKTFPPKG